MAILTPPNTRASYPDLLERGIRKVYSLNYKRYDNGLVEEIFNVVGSEKAQERDVVNYELGLLYPKVEGGNVQFDAMGEAWLATYIHVTWALGVEFTEEAIEDNLYVALIPDAGRALARSAAYTRAVNAFDLFNNLSQTVYTAGGSNFPLLSTAQFRADGGTWSNTPANAVGLSQQSLEERLQAWTTGMLDQRGLKTIARPAVLMVGGNDEMLGHRLLQSDGLPQSNNNDPNPVKDRRNLRLFVNPHLNTDGRWFLIGAKEEVGLNYFDRVAPGVQRYDGGYGGDTGNVRMRCRMRNSHGATHVSAITGSKGS